MAEEKYFVTLNVNYAQINEINDSEGQSQVLTPHLTQPVPIVKIMAEEIDWTFVEELKPDEVPKPIKVISLASIENKIDQKLMRIRKMQDKLEKCLKRLNKLDDISGNMEKKY